MDRGDESPKMERIGKIGGGDAKTLRITFYLLPFG